MHSDDLPIDFDALDARGHGASSRGRAPAAPDGDAPDAGAGDADIGADGEWIAGFLPGLVNR